MAQKLIVEGNDGIVIANLCRKAGLSAPAGYESPKKFKEEFISNSGGFDSALKVLEQAINQADLTNIGLVVDANDAGYSSRWQSIRTVLAKKYEEQTLINADQQAGPKVIYETSLPKVGVWIMPDNQNTGYLEHFLAQSIQKQDELWNHAQYVLSNLEKLPFNELTSNKSGKATLHTWLAWKKEPGKPFGQAVEANYFNVKAAVLAPFFQWINNTFELSKI